MPLGRPAITTPNSLQLQALQQTFANIRERFAAVEAVIVADERVAAEVVRSGSGGLSAVQAAITALAARVLALEQAAGGGGGEASDDANYTASGALSQGQPVWLSSLGTVSAIDPDDPTAAAGYIGITTQTVADGQPVTVRQRGIVEIVGASFIVGQQVYAALGGVTQEPTGNALPVGAAVSATELAVAPGTLALAAAGFDGEDFLPVTYGLAAAALELAALFDLVSTPGPQDGDTLVFDAFAGVFLPRVAAPRVIEPETGDSYTFVEADQGKAKVLDGISGLSIDAVLTADMPAGFACTVVQRGVGEVVFLPETGAVLLNWQMHSATAGDGARCELLVIENPGGAAVWQLSGDTAP